MDIYDFFIRFTHTICFAVWVIYLAILSFSSLVKEGFEIIDLVDREVGFDSTVVQDDYAVTHLTDFLKDMGGEDDRGTAPLGPPMKGGRKGCVMCDV